MGKMLSELKTTQDIVQDILEEHPDARSSDNLLFCMVYQLKAKQNGIDINSMSVPAFFLNLSSMKLPSIETIRRTRQRIQALHPELCGDDEVESTRELNREEYKKYATGFWFS